MKRFAIVFTVVLLAVSAFAQQDWIRTGTGLGVEKLRLAVPDFKAPAGTPAELATTFNATLWNDLDNAGLFDMVSKSFYPLQTPGAPQEYTASAWNVPPPDAAMVAFGSLSTDGTNLTVLGWLYDVRNQTSPQVLGKQYREAASADGARTAAHKFANEIIFRLGGGIAGITESKIVYVCANGRNKEICIMDYDGANSRQLTRLGSIALSPHLSPDGSRIAFSALAGNSWNILMYSLELGRTVNFPHFGGTNLSPSWSGDGTKIVFSSSRSGDPEIYVVSANGADLKRLTSVHGPDVSPVFNPQSGAQIAWVSGRTGLPQIYVMGADGTNPQKMTDQGYAVSPSWSPNGQFLAFSWLRRYGPGAPGARDIYIMDIATGKWAQLTHDGGANDFPSWSPDGRHIVFQSSRSGGEQIWSMLADGSQQRQLTRSGRNSEPAWSFK